MSKYAIISDPHANIQALSLVLKDAEKKGVDKIICLGDLVNKYFYPSEVVDEIRNNSDIVVKGNHDFNVVNNPNFRWVRSKLGTDRLDYLDNLPISKQILINNIIVSLFHATPNSLTKMFNPAFKQKSYPGGIEKNPENMFIGDYPQVSFVGHTHQRFIGKYVNGKFELIKDNSVILDKNDKAIINVGSAGENDDLYLEKNGKTNFTISDTISYAIVDELSDGSVKVDLVEIPYVETLKKVFLDRKQMEQVGMAPLAPRDDEKIYESINKIKRKH